LLVQAGAVTLATVSGGIVAAAAGLDGFFNWGERAQLQRRVAERLKDEGVAFLTGQGVYAADSEAARKAFKDQLAKITQEHRRDYDAARSELGGPQAAGLSGAPTSVRTTHLASRQRHCCSGRWLSHKGLAAALDRL
jgi:hypothetical protein